MKLYPFQSAALIAFTLILPAGADVIYSGLTNMAIPTTFTGATVTIDGGTLNPFFGGVGVANNDLLQPFRESTSNLGTLLNFSIGTTLDASDLYLSTGYGGSQDHLGDTFSTGSEGYHSLALKSDGTVVGWGYNSYGQITIPSGLSGVTALAAGGDNATGYGHSLALKSGGTVVGWGNNSYGQITIPSGLSGVTAIATRWGHSLALKSDGTVVGWGSNNSGQTTVPAGLNGVAAIAAGNAHSLALKPKAP